MLLTSISIIDHIILQPVRFRLNHAGGGATRPSQDKEYSLWVGDLTPEVDDYTLYKAFAARYPSIRTAKGWY